MNLNLHLSLKRGDIAYLKLKPHKYGYDHDDVSLYNRKKIIIEFIDRDEPRFLVKPEGLPAIYVYSDELLVNPVVEAVV